MARTTDREGHDPTRVGAERDIEELRRIAHAQQAQIRLLLEAVEQNRELAKYNGAKGDPQLVLKMLEELQAKANAAQETLARAEATRKEKPETERKSPASSGPTEQPRLPVIAADRGELVLPWNFADAAK